MQIYLVGGAVRDELLGLPVHDRDWVVVGASPEQMLADGFKPVGADFPVFLHPDSHEEYALARSEKKVAPGYQGFVFQTDVGVTLEEDLLRRDLTINAMAKAADGSVVDPYGGQADIEARLLRHVSDAFVEDPVRCLRLARFMARFAGLGFSVADETAALVAKIVAAGEVDALVPERVWAELVRALVADQPQQFFLVLHELAVAERIHAVLPEVAERVASYASVANLDALNTWAVYLHEIERGDALGKHLRAPNEFREAARKIRHIAVHGTDGDNPGKMRDASGWLTLLTRVDAIRQQALLEQLRPALEWLEATQRLPPQFVVTFYGALYCVAAVKGRDLDLQGKSGPEIRDVIDAERQRRLAEFLPS